MTAGMMIPVPQGLIVHLKVTNFLSSIGAVHHYGRLLGPWGEADELGHRERREIDVERLRTALEARTLNKMERRSGGDYVYGSGVLTRGLNSPEDVIETAQAAWREHFADFQVLLLGDTMTYEPKRILAAPNMGAPEVADFNAIAAAYDVLDWIPVPDKVLAGLNGFWHTRFKAYMEGLEAGQ